MDTHKFLKPYRIDHGDKFRLKDFDPGDINGFKSKEHAKELLRTGVKRLAELQDKLYAQDRWALLLIFQAMDAAGKDGTIKHVMSGVNPQGCQVYSFKAPSARGARPRLPLAHARAACPSAAASASSTARTTRRCSWCACTRRSCNAQKLPPTLVTKDIWKERYEDISQLRALPRAQRRRDPQVLPARLEGGAEAAVPRAARASRRRTGSSRPPTSRSASYWDDYMNAYEDVIRAHGDAAGAVVRRAGRQQVVHAPRRRRRGHRRARGARPRVSEGGRHQARRAEAGEDRIGTRGGGRRRKEKKNKN